MDLDFLGLGFSLGISDLGLGIDNNHFESSYCPINQLDTLTIGVEHKQKNLIPFLAVCPLLPDVDGIMFLQMYSMYTTLLAACFTLP